MTRWPGLIELTGWFDIFGIVLNTLFIGMTVFCVLGSVILIGYIVYPIAQGILWCIGFELSIRRKENG